MAAQYGTYEVVLTGNGGVSNPFNTKGSVTFTSPTNQSVTVNDFFDGGNTWRARTYVTEVGTWHWSASSAGDPGLNASGSFVASDTGLPGLLKLNPNNPRTWVDERNDSFIYRGDAAWLLFNQNSTFSPDYQAFVNDAATQGINTIGPAGMLGAWGSVNPSVPGLGNNDPWASGDNTRYDLSKFQTTDTRLEWIFKQHPEMYVQGQFLGTEWQYNNSWLALPQSVRDNTLDYMVARWGAFPNMIWLVSEDQFTDQPSTQAFNRSVGPYLNAHDPWNHLLSTQSINESFAFTTAADLNWVDYVPLQAGSDPPVLGGDLVNGATYGSVPRHIQMTEDWYEQDDFWHAELADTSDIDFFVRWDFWSWMLAGGSANYGARTFKVDPYSRTGTDTYIEPISPNTNFSGRRLKGLDSLPHLVSYLQSRNIDLTLFTANNSLITSWSKAGGLTWHPNVAQRGNNEFLIYSPNAGQEGHSAHLDTGRTASFTVNLTSATGNYQVEWYRPKDGTVQSGPAVSGGASRTFTAPWQGTDVVLRLVQGPAAPPVTPTNLSAASGNGQVTLNWTASSGAGSYNIYRSTTPGGEGATPYQTGVLGTSFTNTGLTNGTTYYYQVTAVNSGGESGKSSEASATPQVTAPAAPTNFTAAAGNVQVSLSWTASAGASSYNVYRSTSAGGEGTTPYRTGLSGSSFTDTGLINGTTYYYQLAAVNAAGQSPKTSEVSATPQAAGALVLAIDAGGGASGSYVADTDFSSGNVSSTTDAINTTGVSNAAPQAVYQTERYGNFTYTVPNLSLGTSYLVRLHFAEFWWSSAGSRVFNVSINGTTVLSNFDIFAAAGGKDIAVVRQFTATADSSGRIVIQFTTISDNAKVSGIEILTTGPVTTPAVPANVAVTAGNAQATLNWSSSAGATSYNIYRSTTSGAEGSAPYRTGVGGTSFIDSGLTNGTTYYYQVSAVNSASESGKSAEVHAAPIAPDTTPPTISGVSATSVTTTGGSITWATNEPADTQVEYGTTTAYGSATSLNGALVTNHAAALSGLTPGTTYHFRVKSHDAAGNLQSSPDFSLTTAAAAAATPRIIDDGSAGNTLVGSWKRVTGRGYGNDIQNAKKGNGSIYSKWEFANVTNGQYQVWATWRISSANATNAPFTLYDNTRLLSTVRVNQKVTPNSLSADGALWHLLGTVTITSGKLVVKLTNAANNQVVADAIRIQGMTSSHPALALSATTPPSSGAASISNAAIGATSAATLTSPTSSPDIAVEPSSAPAPGEEEFWASFTPNDVSPEGENAASLAELMHLAQAPSFDLVTLL